MKNHKSCNCTTAYKIFFLFVNFFLVTGSFAATNKATDFKKMTEQADVIVVGTYGDVSSAWEKSKVYTSAVFQVENVVKGNVASSIKIKALGGTALHPRLNTPVVMNVSNGANFISGSEAVVFLKKNSDGSYQVVGMSKGNIPVLIDENKEKYMGSGLSRIASKQNVNKTETKIHHEKMSLDHFVEYIKSLKRNTKESH